MEMNAFLDALLAKMTLREKIGQFNYPHAEGLDSTGIGRPGDTLALIRRGEICGTSAGSGVADRRELQRIALEEAPNAIPLLFGKDCIQRYATGGPIPLALSCSWDLDLIGRIAEMTAREARADGVNINWAPMLDICFDARWGRIAEGNGELPYLASRIAETIVRGYQGEGEDLRRQDRMMATMKHFAGYGLSFAGRDYASVEASVATLYRIMEPFRAGVAAGAGAVMVAFSAINDIPATAHGELILKVLRERFGFEGIIVTDFTAVDPELVNHGIAADAREAAYLAFKAGVNLDLVSGAFLTHLEGLVEEGEAKPDDFRRSHGAYRFGPVTVAEIDERCREVLTAKYRLGLFDDPWTGLNTELRDRVIRAPAHVKLVREAAAKSLVLLKNEGALPLARDGSTIAVIGPMADNRIDMQGTWAIDVDPQHSVTVIEGIREIAGPGAIVLHAKGCNIVDDPRLALRLNIHNMHMPSVVIGPESPEAMRAGALAAAEMADTIVMVMGEAKEHAGESSTRADVILPGAQRELVREIAAYARSAGKKLVVIAIAGRPLALAQEAELADALIWTGHPGAEGGRALADILFGNLEPSGRLSQALPRSVGQLPLRSEELPTGRPHEGLGVSIAGDDAPGANGLPAFRKFTTASILEEPHTPLFPAGYGLTYTSFAYGRPVANRTRLSGDGDVLEVTVEVANTGARKGVETVQLYLRDPVAIASRPKRELRDFARVELAPGEKRSVVFRLRTEALKYWRGETLSSAVHDWEPGDFDIMVGPDIENVQSLRVHWSRDEPA